MKRFYFPTIAGLVILSVCWMRFINLPANSFSWDVFGYYLYLPASIIHNDIGIQNQTWLDAIMTTYNPSSTLYQLNTQEGGFSIKYTQGMAWLYLPFFLIAHTVATLFGFEADGFSFPYQIAVNAGMLFYFIAGLWAIYQVIRRYFNDQIAIITLTLMYFGTNLFQMSDDMLVHPHIALFSLFAFLLYFSSQWHRERSYRNAVFIGIILGFMILVRPTSAIGALIPILWNFEGFKSELLKFKRARHQLFASLLITTGIASLQLLYWKLATGSWFYFSYNNPGEGLDFLNPHTVDFLFSFRKGWFVYTPLGALMIIGFWFLYKKQKSNFWALSILVVLSIYIMSSWSTWYYAGGSFSSRTLVNIYPIMAVGLAAFLSNLNGKWKYAMGALFSVLVVLNLFQTWQWNERIIDQSRMTKAYYFNIFGKTTIQPEWEKDLLVFRSPEPNPPIENPELYDTVQVIEVLEGFNVDTIIQGIQMQKLDSAKQFSKAYSNTFEKLINKDHAWLVISGSVYIPNTYAGETPLLVNHFKHNDGVYKYRAYAPENVSESLVHYNYPYLTPEVRSHTDEYNTYWWHRGKNTIFVSSLKIAVLERAE